MRIASASAMRGPAARSPRLIVWVYLSRDEVTGMWLVVSRQSCGFTAVTANRDGNEKRA